MSTPNEKPLTPVQSEFFVQHAVAFKRDIYVIPDERVTDKGWWVSIDLTPLFTVNDKNIMHILQTASAWYVTLSRYLWMSSKVAKAVRYSRRQHHLMMSRDEEGKRPTQTLLESYMLDLDPDVVFWESQEAWLKEKIRAMEVVLTPLGQSFNANLRRG